MGGNNQRRARGRETKRDLGVSLIEVVVITPIIIFVLLGAIEASFFVFQNFDVRNAAREAGRLAATNEGSSDDIAEAVCEAMYFRDSTAVILSGDRAGPGENLEAVVTRQAQTLTGFVYLVLDPPIDIVSRATPNVESAPAVWVDGTFQCNPIVTAASDQTFASMAER
jgi:Flp pilus assembly protein TadG